MLNGCPISGWTIIPKKRATVLIPLTEIQENGVPAVIAEIRRVIGSGPAFISFDLDVLTLSDAPAVADPEAGGSTINEALQMLRGFRGLDVVGGDVVCFVPHLDPSMVTAIHTNAIMHDIVDGRGRCS